MALFEITKRFQRGNRSLLLPATPADAARGLAFIEDVSAPGISKLVHGTLRIVGFITRPGIVGFVVLFRPDIVHAAGAPAGIETLTRSRPRIV
jgi:hypothetical protein